MPRTAPRIALSFNTDEVRMLSQVLTGSADLRVLARNPRFLRLVATIQRARKRADAASTAHTSSRDAGGSDGGT